MKKYSLWFTFFSKSSSHPTLSPLSKLVKQFFHTAVVHLKYRTNETDPMSLNHITNVQRVFLTIRSRSKIGVEMLLFKH